MLSRNSLGRVPKKPNVPSAQGVDADAGGWVVMAGGLDSALWIELLPKSRCGCTGDLS